MPLDFGSIALAIVATIVGAILGHVVATAPRIRKCRHEAVCAAVYHLEQLAKADIGKFSSLAKRNIADDLRAAFDLIPTASRGSVNDPVRATVHRLWGIQ